MKHFSKIIIGALFFSPLCSNNFEETLIAKHCTNPSCTCDPCTCDPCSCTQSNCCPLGKPTDRENLTDGCSYCQCSPCSCAPSDFIAPCPPENCGYNCPQFLDLKCSWDIGIYGAFLYFQAKEEGLEVAAITDLDSVQNTVNTSLVNMSFDYKPAFRVGLSANFCNDNWVMYAEYLWYHTTNGQANTSVDAETDATLIANSYWGGFTNDDFSEFSSTYACTSYDAKSSWTLDLDIVDLQLARRYFVGQCLTFMPHVGLRAAWIDQQYNAEYFCLNVIDNEALDLNSKNSSSSWAIGPKGGIDTNWNFCCGVRFFQNTNLSILYTDYDSIKSSSNGSITTDGGQLEATGSYSNTECHLRPEADIALGIGWGDYFCCNSFYFDLAFAYEAHVFWDQNMLPKNGDYSTIPSALRGNLYLHGLSVTARLDF